MSANGENINTGDDKSPLTPDAKEMENGSHNTPETDHQITDSPECPRENLPPAKAKRRGGGNIEPFQITGSEDTISRRTSYITKTGMTRGGSRRTSSLELRRLPVNVLLAPYNDDAASVLSDDFPVKENKKKALGEQKDLLHIFCLRPGYSLRTQLMLSFGTITIVTIVAVVITCVAVTVLSGENVKNTSKEAFEGIATSTQALSARYLAESLSEKLLLYDVVRFMREATQDRFAGYPSASDANVPFFDILSGESKYPIDFPPPPLEWQWTTNINEDNFEEHFQNREYYRTRNASTANAAFLFKGVCDPAETDPAGDAYWPNCTDANNDISTGGVWEPTNTTEMVYRKGKDLTPLLKAFFESHDVIRDLGIYFSNSGAGASLTYPHYPISSQSTYVSAGCEWMLSPNPYDPSRTLGTPEMIARCSPAGENVSSRIYSPMEREWCIIEALQPDRVHFGAGLDAWDGSWVVGMGQAVFDRESNEFIACIYVGISLESVSEELAKAAVVDGEILSLVEWNEEGTIVASSVDNRNTREASSIFEGGLGVSSSDYERLLALVDYEVDWKPEQVRSAYANYFVNNEKYFVSAYPVPPIPDEFDPSYTPLFMVVVSTPAQSVFGAMDEVGDYVDARVRDINTFCLVAGAIGLAVALITIVMMSEILTKPLRRMNEIAGAIVANFGELSKEKIGEDTKGEMVVATADGRCTPKTELSDVVREFNKMVAGFSGSHMVKSEAHKHHEVYNSFCLKEDFLDLYKERESSNYEFVISPPYPKDNGDDSMPKCNDAGYLHKGTNILDIPGSFTTPGPRKLPDTSTRKTFSSPLFLWIVALIVVPLLAVNIIITAIALNSVSKEFTDGIERAEDFFLEVEKTRLWVHSQLRADFVSSLTSRSISDLHALARYSEWVLFGGLPRTESFAGLSSGIESCKGYEDRSECPFVPQHEVCDCEWNDRIDQRTCQFFPDGSRGLQENFWVCQADDADENGNRPMSTYPVNSFTPATATWWDDQLNIPGSSNVSLAESPISDLFQRLQSAASIPIFQALYNYAEIKETTIASYLAFESDGLFTGYKGCANTDHVNLASFQSTVQNGAARLRPELCPLGKFGYDPRCRGWYDAGRNLAVTEDQFLHLTAPYEFATDGVTVALSATAALIDPRTGEYVGQVLLDFLPTRMLRVIKDDTPLTNNGFPVLIATEDTIDADTIVGPGYTLSDPPSPISDFVLKYDTPMGCERPICIENQKAFESVVAEMKSGSRGNATFFRTTENGKQEKVHIAFAPVSVRSFRSIDSSDFSRGVDVSDYLIYSIALAETDSGILEAFDPIQEESEQQKQTAIGILSVLLALATILVVYVSIRVTQSITTPMVYLLDVIRSIRKAETEKAPDLRDVRASREIVQFADSIEMLSRVVESANSAFYAGQFERAYYVLVDALRLFRRLNNKKAIGIACNNLGNTMMGMFQEMAEEKLVKLGGITRKQLVSKGIAYYHEAIQLGEKAYDEFYNLNGWTPICLQFMQHLSNRYFNRGLFLLTVKDCHEKPDDLEKLGKRDLQIAFDMDAEVISYGEDIGWSQLDRIAKIFEIKIARLGGYNLLLELGYEDEWGVKEMLQDAFEITVSEAKASNESELFTSVTLPGRLQELETEILKYYESRGDTENAAKTAVRSLFEDERVFVDTLSRALDALSRYVASRTDLPEETSSRIIRVLQDQADMLEDTVNHQTEASVNEMDSSLLLTRSGRRFSARNWSLQQSSGRFVTMEDF